MMGFSKPSILNKDGNWQWAKWAGGTDYDVGTATTTLSDDTTIVIGSFSGSATFGKGESCETVLVSDGSTDIFVAHYYTDGTIMWAKRAGGTSVDVGQGIVTLSGDSTIVIGYFSGSATFGKGESAETVLVSDGSADIFVAKYNPDGTIAWAKRAGGTDYDVGVATTTLSDDSTIVIGSFSGIADFGPYNLTSQGDSDVFVAKIGNQPPEINNVMYIASDPLDTDIGWENFSCTVTDNTAVNEVKLVLIGDTTTEYPMIKDGDNYYCNITISTADEYTYHIWANDTSDNEATSIPQPFDLPMNEDVDMNGQVYFEDLIAIVMMYGDTGANGGWVREDVDNNGEVYFDDLVAVVMHYGEWWT